MEGTRARTDRCRAAALFGQERVVPELEDQRSFPWITRHVQKALTR